MLDLLTRCRLLVTYTERDLEVLEPAAFAQNWRDHARLDLGSAAVNEQFNSRDETGVIRSQKQRRLRNFVGLPHPFHRDGGHNPRNHVWRLPTRRWRIDRTRANNV